MNAYTIQQGFETKVDGTDGEYWMIIAPDGQAVATETHKGKAELAARVWNNQFAVQNERISILTAERDELQFRYDHANLHVAELMKENERMKAALLAIREIVDGAKPADYPVFSIVSDINVVLYELEQAPHAAPVQAEAVTLTDSEIEWIGKHWDMGKDTFSRANDFGLPDGIRLKKFGKRVDGNRVSTYYRLSPEFDTEANRAAIEDYRKNRWA